MTPRATLLFGVCALALQGCMDLGHRPVVENRYKSATFTPVAGEEDRASFAISVATAVTPAKGSAMAFTSLSDRAQAAYIAELKGKPPPVEIKGDEAAKAARVTFQSTLKRRFVISVRPIAAFLPPGDRLESVSIWLRVAEPHTDFWTISGWSQASNASETIELGSIQRTEGSKLTVGGGLEATSGSIGATTIGLERSTQNQETGKVVDETKLSAGVKDGLAWLTQRGGARRDLTGNYEIDTTLSVVDENYYPVPATKASALVTDDPKAPSKLKDVPASQVDLTLYTTYSAKVPDRPVCGKATLLYRVRQITSGAPTLSESDDVIDFRSGTAEADFIIAPPTVLPRYGLSSQGEFMVYRFRGAPQTLTFASLEEAEAFADWLSRNNPANGKLHNTDIGLSLLTRQGAGLRPLTKAEALGVKAELTNPDQIAESQAQLAKGCVAEPAPASPTGEGEP